MIPITFLSHACDILGDTNEGLRGAQIASLCASYSVQYDVKIPYGTYPFDDSPNKRTALLKNLQAFSPAQQYLIISELCDLEIFDGNSKVRDVKIKLISRYGAEYQSSERMNELLVEETKHWLEEFDKPYELYCHALEKINNRIFERNAMDDLRLSLELLLQQIFNNAKSLENQVSDVGNLVTSKGGSKEFTNMFQKLVDYYAKYNNTYVKHDDMVMELEIEFVFELASSFLKHFVRVDKR